MRLSNCINDGSPAPTFVSKTRKSIVSSDKCLSFLVLSKADEQAILLQVTTATLCLKNARMF
jgi:hypothetical protein